MPKHKNNYNGRLLVIALGIFFLFSLLIVHYYHLQVVEHDHWKYLADRQHFFTIEEPFVRGSFYGNSSCQRGHPSILQPLAYDLEKYHLYVDPYSIPEEYHLAVIAKLLNALPVSSKEKERLPLQFRQRSRSRRLAMWLGKEDKDNILAWWKIFAKEHEIPFNALYFVSDYQRVHPYGKLLGQVLHTVQSFKDEKTKQAIPTGGLELSLKNYLAGSLGKRKMMRSPKNALELGEIVTPPRDGDDIYLTINPVMQAIAEEELLKGVKNSNARGAWAVMMDPRTGEILVLAQYPFFDPGLYQEFFNDPLLLNETKVKAIQEAQEPGSSFKPILCAIALMANQEVAKKGEPPVFDPEEMMDVSRGWFPGRRKPIVDLSPAHYIDMNMAVQKSSNIYLATVLHRVIDRMGEDWYRKQLVDVFGFGKTTGIELHGETAGMVPTPGKLHPNGKLEWSKSTPASMAMGHNILVTSMQMMRAHALLINGGYYVTPTLVKKIVSKDGCVLLDNTSPERINAFPHLLDPEIGKRVVTSMKYVTQKTGSGHRAMIAGYSRAGKTGTAHKIVNGAYASRLHCSNFIGFVPADDPAFLLIVVVDEPEAKYIPGEGHNHRGAMCAAPIFREIASRSIRYLGVTPDDPAGYPAGDPRHNPEKAWWRNETRLLQEKYKTWNIPK